VLKGGGRTKGSRGQALVEFALVVPVLVVLLVALFDVGRVVWASDSVSHGASEAARFAIVHGGSSGTACPVGPAGPDAIVPVASGSCPNPSPSKQSIRDAATTATLGVGGTVTVAVCYGVACSGDTNTVGATDARGTPVTVRVQASLSLVTGSLLAQPNYTVSATTTMVVNN
jgi:Flp pilus assembly protein TadG